jgi:putative flippase GtrA
MKQKIDEFVERIVGRKLNKGVLQFFRYLICGGIATLTDISILFVLTHFLHINYLIAAAGAFLTGTTVNYSLNIILVFKSSGETKKEFPLFALIGIGGLVWTEIILWIMVGKMKVYVMIAKMVAIVLVLNWNFFMRKKFVFVAEPISEDEADYSSRITRNH